MKLSWQPSRHSLQLVQVEDHWSKNGSNEIDIPAETMDAILTYMYTGKVADIDKTPHDLLPKAEEYHLEGLKTMCEEALSKTLTVQTVIDILLLANTHNAHNLKHC